MSQWPVIFLSQEDQESIKTALSAIIETRKRVAAYLEKRKKQRFDSQYKAAFAQKDEILKDLGEEIIALSHKEIILNIISLADANKVERKRIVTATLGAINRAMAGFTPNSVKHLHTGWYLEHQNATDNKKLIVQIKDILARQDRVILAGPDTYLVDKIIRNLCDNCTCNQLISLIIPCEDGEIFDAVTESGPLKKQLLKESVEQDRKYAKALNDEYYRAKKSYDDLKEKIAMSEMWLTEPLENVIARVASNKLDFLVESLCVIEKTTCSKVMSAEFADANLKEVFKNLIENYSLFIGSSVHLWRIFLVQILAETGGIIGNMLAPWVHSLIDFLVKHPLKIKKVKMPIDADKAKAVFAKLGAHYLKGYHPDEQCMGNTDKWGQHETEPNSYLQAVSVYFASVMTNNPVTSPDNAERQNVINDLFQKIIIPNIESIIRWMHECATNATADGQPIQTFDELVKPFVIDGSEPQQESQALEVEEIKLKTWYYVHNPEHGMTVSEPVVFSNSEELEGYFRKHRVDAVIKPESIMNALAQYKLTPQSIRAIMPQEYCGREGWHKIKRGKLRILARLDEKEQLYFHLYPRKEWEYRAAV